MAHLSKVTTTTVQTMAQLPKPQPADRPPPSAAGSLIADNDDDTRRQRSVSAHQPRRVRRPRTSSGLPGPSPPSASAASAASHAQPVYGYGVPDTGGHDDSDGAIAGGQPITSLLPIGMAVHVFTYGQRRPATITGHTPNGDVEFKVSSSGVWRTWYETRPPSFFGIGQATPQDETADTADQPDADAADGLTATAAASPQRVWRGATQGDSPDER